MGATKLANMDRLDTLAQNRSANLQNEEKKVCQQGGAQICAISQDCTAPICAPQCIAPPKRGRGGDAIARPLWLLRTMFGPDNADLSGYVVKSEEVYEVARRYGFYKSEIIDTYHLPKLLIFLCKIEKIELLHIDWRRKPNPCLNLPITTFAC